GLGGAVIRVGPGMPDRINPLDAGTRPQLNGVGKPLGDAEWNQRVRVRRMAILNTMVKILVKRELSPGESHAISLGLDQTVEAAADQQRTVILPDVINQLELLQADDPDKLVREGAAVAKLVLSRMTSGDLGGMLDGPSTVAFDHDATAVSIDTSSLVGVNRDVARVVAVIAGDLTEDLSICGSACRREW